jgi:ribonuclease HII
MRVQISAQPKPGRLVRHGPDFSRERALYRNGLAPVAGIDEVGRGPLAGPVIAAAVILDPEHVVDGLDDSKKLSLERRELLYDAIFATAQVAVASVSAIRIDVVNIRMASLEAMRRAVAALPCSPAFVLVDGRDLPDFACPGEAVVGGDGLIASIAAASIVAKVTRDRMMRRLGMSFPAYGFSDHVGYATARHRQALQDHGPCPFHRMSFSPFRSDNEAAE